MTTKTREEAIKKYDEIMQTDGNGELIETKALNDKRRRETQKAFRAIQFEWNFRDNIIKQSSQSTMASAVYIGFMEIVGRLKTEKQVENSDLGRLTVDMWALAQKIRAAKTIDQARDLVSSHWRRSLNG